MGRVFRCDVDIFYSWLFQGPVVFPRWSTRNLRIEHVDIVRRSLQSSGFSGSAGSILVVSESRVKGEGEDGRLFF